MASFIPDIPHAGPQSSYPTLPATPSSSFAPVITNNPLFPVVVTLGAVVLLLITCVVLLVLALAVTATKLNKLRAEKGYSDTPHYYNQRGRGEGETTERIFDEAEEGTGPSEEQPGPYQELELGTIVDRHYESLNKDTITEA